MIILFTLLLLANVSAQAAMPDAEYQVRFAMREATSPRFSYDAFLKLPQIWGRPDLRPGTPAFYTEFFKRYGLHKRIAQDRTGNLEDILPLGLVLTKTDFKARHSATFPNGHRGVTVTCEACHTSMQFGQRIVGVGNPFFHFEKMYADLTEAEGGASSSGPAPYLLTPGQASMVNGADHIGVFGLYMRGNGLRLILTRALAIKNGDIPAELMASIHATPYMKTPAWINFKTKYEASRTGYGFFADGGLSRDAIFSDFTYLVSFSLDLSGLFAPTDLRRARRDWDRSARDYLFALTPPLYPFAVDIDKARRGFSHFENTCARCHGNYSTASWETGHWTRPQLMQYTGKIIRQEVIGTNRKRIDFTDVIKSEVNRVLARVLPRTQMVATHGYVVPPLHGIYARYPYLHTGAVPDVATLLTPPAQRPKRWMFTGDPNRLADYDQDRLGIKTKVLSPGEPVDAHDRVYEEALEFGLSNEGHPFGTNLGDVEKSELIEFLKTL